MMKHPVSIKYCLWLFCIGFNIFFSSCEFQYLRSKNYERNNVIIDQSFDLSSDYKINYLPIRRPKWPAIVKPQCPKFCACYVSIVKCRNKNLIDVPLLRLPTLKTLRIQNTQIRALRKEHFRQMFHLTDLQLNNNKLFHLENHSFEDLIRIQTLNLSNNKLQAIDRYVFRRLVSLKELDLTNNRLRDIEVGLGFLANLNALYLSGNKIKVISNATFYGNSKVRVLDLSFNRIKFISWNAFSRMKSLTTLLMNNNPIKHLDVHFDSNLFLEQLDVTHCSLERLFKDSPRQLKDLRLSGNELTAIRDEDFINSNAIELLLLNDNKIEILSDTVFDYMPLLHDLYLNKNRLTKLPIFMPSRLYSLYASHNNISSITWKPLSKKYNLHHLVLSHNKISHIDPFAMRSLVYLVYLDLSYNDIKYLKAGMFGRTRKLERLDISHNPLQLLEPGCFIGLTKLHILKVSSIAYPMDVDATASFEDLHNLLYLDLSNSSFLTKQLLLEPSYGRHLESLKNLNILDTGLKHLPYKLKTNLPNLTTIRMTSNPWHCNKRLLWIKDWIRTSSVDFYEPENLVCKSPPRLKGRRLMDLTSYEVVSPKLLKEKRKQEKTKVDDLFNKRLQILSRKLRKVFDS